MELLGISRVDQNHRISSTNKTIEFSTTYSILYSSTVYQHCTPDVPLTDEMNPMRIRKTHHNITWQNKPCCKITVTASVHVIVKQENTLERVTFGGICQKYLYPHFVQKAEFPHIHTLQFSVTNPLTHTVFPKSASYDSLPVCVQYTIWKASYLRIDVCSYKVGNHFEDNCFKK